MLSPLRIALVFAILATAELAIHTPQATAGGWFGRARVRTTAATCSTGQCSTATGSVVTTYAAVQVQTMYATTYPDYATALAILNQARAAAGRPPLAWDSELARWAAANYGVHGVCAPGASQCQAWCHDPVTAVRQWLASGPHWANIANAQHSAGIGASAGGFTLNLR